MDDKTVELTNALLNLVLLTMQIYQQVSQKNRDEVIAEILIQSNRTDELIKRMKGD